MKFRTNLHLSLISDFVILSDFNMKSGTIMITNNTILKRIEIKSVMVNKAVILKLS